MNADDTEIAAPSRPDARRMSYKFQRLRERIRAAIEAGELIGKLPGERSLAKQFNVNAKTLSKALTDLAAEGVLQRNVGLGTFVRGEGDAPVAPTTLLISDPSPGVDSCPLAAAFARRGLVVETLSPDDELLPSTLAPFDLFVIDSSRANEGVVRDLLVRGKNVVTVDHVSRPYSTHALLPNVSLAASIAARDLVTRGHVDIALIPDDPDDSVTPRVVADAVPQAKVRVTPLDGVLQAARDGATAVLCGSGVVAEVERNAAAARIHVPEKLALIAYGRTHGPPRWCGYYVTEEMIADALLEVLNAGLPHTPLTLWLTGENVFLGTVGDTPLPNPPHAAGR